MVPFRGNGRLIDAEMGKQANGTSPWHVASTCSASLTLAIEHPKALALSLKLTGPRTNGAAKVLVSLRKGTRQDFPRKYYGSATLTLAF